MFRRLLGLVIMIVSMIVVALLVWGALMIPQAIDSTNDGLDNFLTLALDTLSNVTLTLEQTRATLVEAGYALDTASLAAANLSQTMGDMQPLLASTEKVVTEDVPNNIEAIQDTIPNIAQVAGIIDDVLRTLSNFGIERTIPIPLNPITIDFDLGIDYAPEEPFDQSIRELGSSLEGMPEELRSLQGDLNILSNDLELLTGNIETAAGDIEKINEQVALYLPIIDEYLRIVDQTETSLLEAQAQIANQLETARAFSIVFLLFLTLTQLAPLYIGWELFSGQRAPATSKESVPQAPLPDTIDKPTKAYPQVSSGDPDQEVEQESNRSDSASFIEDTNDSSTERSDVQPQDSKTVIDSMPQTSDSEDDQS